MTTSSPPIAEIVSIGDEMTSGARLDTNSQWLSEQLGYLGIRVLYHTTVGDAIEACVAVFQAACRRADIVICTGGLGPTADDLTRQALADTASVALEFRPEALEHIEKLFNLRNREMPAGNRIQAMFPAGSEIIPNPQGTAPGIDLQIELSLESTNNSSSTPTDSNHPAALKTRPDCRVFALPGVPAEMTQMYEDSVRPRLLEDLGQTQVIRRHVIKCFGLGESDMEARLGGMIARNHSPLVGITVSKATISLRIEAIAESAGEAEQQIARVRSEVRSKVGEFVYGEGDDYELHHAVTEALSSAGQRVAMIEIGHAARASNWLASVETARQYAGGLSFPDLEHAGRFLLSPEQTPESQDVEAVSRQIAWAAQQKLAADWCVVVHQYPPLTPPDGQLMPAANVTFTVAGPHADLPHTSTHSLGGHPDILQDRIAKTALFELWKLLHA